VAASARTGSLPRRRPSSTDNDHTTLARKTKEMEHMADGITNEQLFDKFKLGTIWIMKNDCGKSTDRKTHFIFFLTTTGQHQSDTYEATWPGLLNR
jgi:hypothetical protein